MDWLKRYSLLVSHMLCVLVVVVTAIPSLRNPRLEADDYRYLHHIQQWQQGNISAVEAMTVENRWDHLWFMQEEGVIRFFRPTVILSYTLDAGVWGDAYPFGLALTNALIHLACTLLVGYLLLRLIGRGLPAILGAVLFAGLAAHAECIWYIAGRTDSLAALGFLGAFALHVSGRRWWALPCFMFGFITKEMVVAAPVVFMFYDRFLDNRRLDWRLFGGYGLAAGAVLLIKYLAMGGEGSDFVYPYLIDPFSPGFAEHLWIQVRSYLGNLLAAEITVPFSDLETVKLLHRPWVTGAGLLGLITVAWKLRRDGRFWLMAVFGVFCWLPTSFVYLSERYLYLPSVALVGMLALLAETRSVLLSRLLCLALAGFTVFQSVALYNRHLEISNQSGSVREMLEQLEPVRDQIKPADRLLLVNTPGLFVRAQFVENILRVAFDDPDLRVDVLTMMPGQNGTEWKSGDALPVMGAGVEVQWKESTVLELSGKVLSPGTPASRIQEKGMKQFSWLPLHTGSKGSNALFSARISAGNEEGATSIEYRFNEVPEQPILAVWHADCSNLNEHPWERRKKARVRLMRFE